MMARERQGRKGKIQPTECRVPENSKRRKEGLLQQCKQIKEIDGKMLQISSKIGQNKGLFHAWISTINNRNSKDVPGSEEIEKWQEYPEL